MLFPGCKYAFLREALPPWRIGARGAQAPTREPACRRCNVAASGAGPRHERPLRRFCFYAGRRFCAKRIGERARQSQQLHRWRLAAAPNLSRPQRGGFGRGEPRQSRKRPSVFRPPRAGAVVGALAPAPSACTRAPPFWIEQRAPANVAKSHAAA